jgi:hypothetical protein
MGIFAGQSATEVVEGAKSPKLDEEALRKKKEEEEALAERRRVPLEALQETVTEAVEVTPVEKQKEKALTTKIKKKPETIDAMIKRTSELPSGMEKRDPDKHKIYEDKFAEFKTKTQKLKDWHKERRNQAEWGKFAEFMGKIFIKWMAADAGLKKGVDTSGVKFGWPNWKAEMDRIDGDFDREFRFIEAERGEVREAKESEERVLERDRQKHQEVLRRKWFIDYQNNLKAQNAVESGSTKEKEQAIKDAKAQIRANNTVVALITKLSSGDLDNKEEEKTWTNLDKAMNLPAISSFKVPGHTESMREVYAEDPALLKWSLDYYQTQNNSLDKIIQGEAPSSSSNIKTIGGVKYKKVDGGWQPIK